MAAYCQRRARPRAERGGGDPPGQRGGRPELEARKAPRPPQREAPLMISLLIYILVVVIIVGLVLYCIQLLPLQQPFKNVAIIIAVLIAILILLGLIGVIPMRPV